MNNKKKTRQSVNSTEIKKIFGLNISIFGGNRQIKFSIYERVHVGCLLKIDMQIKMANFQSFRKFDIKWRNLLERCSVVEK